MIHWWYIMISHEVSWHIMIIHVVLSQESIKCHHNNIMSLNVLFWVLPSRCHQNKTRTMVLIRAWLTFLNKNWYWFWYIPCRQAVPTSTTLPTPAAQGKCSTVFPLNYHWPALHGRNSADTVNSKGVKAVHTPVLKMHLRKCKYVATHFALLVDQGSHYEKKLVISLNPCFGKKP